MPRKQNSSANGSRGASRCSRLIRTGFTLNVCAFRPAFPAKVKD